MKKTVKPIFEIILIIFVFISLVSIFIFLSYKIINIIYPKKYYYYNESTFLDNECFVLNERLMTIKKSNKNKIVNLNTKKEFDVNEIFDNEFYSNEIIDYYICNDNIYLITIYGIFIIDDDFIVLNKINFSDNISNDTIFAIYDFKFYNNYIFLVLNFNFEYKLVILDLNLDIVKNEELTEKEKNINEEISISNDFKLSINQEVNLILGDKFILINGIKYDEINYYGNSLFNKKYEDNDFLIFATYFYEANELSLKKYDMENYKYYQLWEYDKNEKTLNNLINFKNYIYLINFDSDSYQYYYDGGLYSNDTLIEECGKIDSDTIQSDKKDDYELNIYKICFYVDYKDNKFYYSYNYDVSIYEV